MAHPFIAIEGVIGVGKTTLARLLAKEMHAQTVLEIVEENPFLSSFYQDQERYAFQTQLFFLLSRFRQMQVTAPQILAQSPLASDYMLAKDCIFAALTLPRQELEMHSRLYQILESTLPRPSLVVYLTADTDILMNRIAIRDRSFERQMSRDYIARLGVAYEEFFSRYDDTPLLTIDTNGLNVERNAGDLALVVGRIRAALDALPAA